MIRAQVLLAPLVRTNSSMVESSLLSNSSASDFESFPAVKLLPNFDNDRLDQGKVGREQVLNHGEVEAFLSAKIVRNRCLVSARALASCRVVAPSRL